jgi:methylmalonyl-CoA carboxyltransferase small subunit
LKVQVLVGTEAYEVEIGDLPDEVAAAAALGVSATDQSLLPVLPVSSLLPPGVDESKLCRSPLAAIVVRVNLAAGQQVEAGEVLLVLEAMKMETNITAPNRMKANSVKVVPGDVVKPNQVLVEFE